MSCNILPPLCAHLIFEPLL